MNQPFNKRIKQANTLKGTGLRIFETSLMGLMRPPLAGQVVQQDLAAIHRSSANAMTRAARDRVRPRHRSNVELRKFAPLFDGAIINVSG
ncbi:hypothetical protein PG1C_11160 [Rugosibacter aromaticivorans]|uniref:Uncharacterized protein n=1 Tax=Rugosibacter aromaticivorans TaxID=1565605 RepID=A0A0C5J153_9PROT|nr:hypothetical protein [Rugosibacter aromaticivorans]AJP48837.1 hypothetical protein PG1C_11160 [Rugosibacter aromaticivorans]TBR16008.1 MAG: hypothetical protein EPO43_02030 [Rugosibacter sp.]